MITKFNIFESSIQALIDPYGEEDWDDTLILISDLKENDMLKCKVNIGVLKVNLRYQIVKVMKNNVIVNSENEDTFVLDENLLNEYFELV
jgi:hypothetical protein